MRDLSDLFAPINAGTAPLLLTFLFLLVHLTTTNAGRLRRFLTFRVDLNGQMQLVVKPFDAKRLVLPLRPKLAAMEDDHIRSTQLQFFSNPTLLVGRKDIGLAHVPVKNRF